MVASTLDPGSGDHHLVVALKQVYLPFGTEIAGDYNYVGSYGDYGTATATASTPSTGTISYQAPNVAESGAGPYQFNATHSAVRMDETSGSWIGDWSWGVFMSNDVFVMDSYDSANNPSSMSVGLKRPLTPAPIADLAGTYHYIDKYGATETLPYTLVARRTQLE